MQMSAFVRLTLQESIGQCGAGKHCQWGVYITVHVINHGIIKSISILSAVICPMMKFGVDKPWDIFSQEVKCTLAIRLQLSTLSAWDLDRVHHFPHPLLQDNDTYCLAEGNQ
jgi:hypothetical protein